MTNENIIGKLGKRGLVGVMLGLILLASSAMYYNYKLATNHIEHSNDVMRELSGNVQQNTEVMRSLKSSIDLWTVKSE